MEPDFWHERWQSNKIGFHEKETNALLAKYIDRLNLEEGSRIFVPLCGKTLDIAWLLSQGFRVAGIELSTHAVDQLFEELGVEAEISQAGDLKHYADQNIDIFAGDIFNLTTDELGPVDAVYDRAALVALPQKLRNQYSRHLMSLTNTAPQLLICFEYDQDQMEGPPFSINNAEVKLQYSHKYNISLLEQLDVVNGLRSLDAATESIWLLRSA